ncbi:DUF2779 domain-containing protein [Metamycoplasma neophronis]|uniref:DUF2779 domain-containing protein n=1 Tax=Metamycoplasma neophronis TaxID=872983 RepID=A0ABY2Z0Y0_9BACT|nr:DUF2779 domain-containing protein [Metamycoplasma neophronis]TPR54700.1 DUF2779 domain-containing protein [Metamycoplasma neophronis]
MDSNLVFIDFEAITNPFAKLVNIPSGTPYAYTLGLLSDKNQFKVKTFIMDFNKHGTVNGMWATIKKCIINDINKINSKLNLKDVVFVGHNPVLEHNCLKRLFPENRVEALISNTTVSLSKLTGKIFNEPYFIKIKKIIAASNDKYLSNALGERNGAIASFAGYWLYTKAIKNLRANDKRKKFLINLDQKVLLRELTRYSKDDVVKMIYVVEHPDQTEQLLKELSYKRELLKQLKNLNLDEKLTIKELKEKIWTL